MLFNSYEFIFIFLPISFFVYFFLNKKRLTTASKGWLVFVSLFFYSWWNIVYLPLILISILFNYAITNTMIEYDESKKNYYSKKTVFRFGLAFNIGFLIYFKYMDFFITNVNTLINLEIPLFHLALPLAISFFTLQQIAFLVDSYEGLVKERNFLDYTIFVTFFPQLIAGPIVHHSEMMPQFRIMRNKVKNIKNIVIGLFIFSIGLFKKVVIADTFSVWVTNGFNRTEIITFVEAWMTSLSYTFQLYFDFSGYSDMAIGAALLFNIQIPKNFNSPLKSTGIIEFWQRWHITLSNFITVYIYTPIVKTFNKLTFHKAMIATIITFLIAGLWHGASWMFIIFGGLHGLGLIVNHYWKKNKMKLNNILAWFITFNFVNITFVFFRAEELEDAINILKMMFMFTEVNINEINVFHGPGILTRGMMDIFILTAAFFLIFCKNSGYFQNNFLPEMKYLFFLSVLSGISILFLNSNSEFLYFRF